MVPASDTVCQRSCSSLRMISGVLPIQVPVTGVCTSDIIMRG